MTHSINSNRNEIHIRLFRSNSVFFFFVDGFLFMLVVNMRCDTFNSRGLSMCLFCRLRQRNGHLLAARAAGPFVSWTRIFVVMRFHLIGAIWCRCFNLIWTNSTVSSLHSNFANNNGRLMWAGKLMAMPKRNARSLSFSRSKCSQKGATDFSYSCKRNQNINEIKNHIFCFHLALCGANAGALLGRERETKERKNVNECQWAAKSHHKLSIHNPISFISSSLSVSLALSRSRSLPHQPAVIGCIRKLNSWPARKIDNSFFHIDANG